MSTLAGKTILISGASRGIGLAIALRAAADGANIALLAKTAEPHPKLEGTIYTAAAEIEAAGGRAEAANPHILTLSPPLNMEPRWFGIFPAYTISKYGMSLCTLGWADELAPEGIAANSLWPRTTIGTAAIRNLGGGDAAVARSRRPEIMSDAAHVILTRDSRSCTGNFFIDEDVLRAEGVTDFSAYRFTEGSDDDLDLDFFLEDAPLPHRFG
jgi:NAD(P)-dependent dehydrogenase (short-subunit alcohol dehydrogenase family)